MLIFELVGVDKGDFDHLHQGALDALYFYCISYAIEKGCEAINFGNSNPFLTDGLLRYKKKWGSKLLPNNKQHRNVLVRKPGHCRRFPSFFLDHFPIVLKDEKLFGIIIERDDERMDLKLFKHMIKAYFSPGIEKLVIFSMKGFSQSISQYLDESEQENKVFLSKRLGEEENFHLLMDQ